MPDRGASSRRKTVSYGKYQREQKKQQEAYAALRGQTRTALLAKRGKSARSVYGLDERTKMLIEAIQTPKTAPAAKVDEDPEPNKDDDPLGHLEWRNRKLEKTVSDLQAGRQKDVEQTTAQNEEQRVLFIRRFTADVERAAQADPAFAEMFVHLRESRYQELGYIMAGIDVNDKEAVAALTPEQQMQLSTDIQQTFYNEQMLVARQALKQGRSPAKEVANLARARGWRPISRCRRAGYPCSSGQSQNGNGAVVPANGRAAAAAPAKSVTEELETRIQEGLAASRSLSDGGGAPGAGDLTPERIAKMTDDEFQEFYDLLDAQVAV